MALARSCLPFLTEIDARIPARKDQMVQHSLVGEQTVCLALSHDPFNVGAIAISHQRFVEIVTLGIRTRPDNESGHRHLNRMLPPRITGASGLSVTLT